MNKNNGSLLKEVLKLKTNKVWIGLIIGLIIPALTFFIVFLLWDGEDSLANFYHALVITDSETKLLSLCVLPNLLFFFGFIWLNFLYAARGVLMATFISTLVILGLMIF